MTEQKEMFLRLRVQQRRNVMRCKVIKVRRVEQRDEKNRPTMTMMASKILMVKKTRVIQPEVQN